MNSKKIFAALLVPALSATLFAGAASADYSHDSSTGVRTWTFNKPSSTTTLSGNKYYLYSDTLSTAYSTEADAKAAQSDKDLLIACKSTSQVAIYNSSLTMFSPDSAHTYFTAPCDGTISVSGSEITIDDNTTNSVSVIKGQNVKFSPSASAYIKSITFTPNKSAQDFNVNTITIGDSTTDAGVTFKADGYNNWDCSIWDKVSNFRGNVNFNVTMNNVPADVTVSAESYVK